MGNMSGPAATQGQQNEGEPDQREDDRGYQGHPRLSGKEQIQERSLGHSRRPAHH